jgi:hypothetical protein
MHRKHRIIPTFEYYLLNMTFAHTEPDFAVPHYMIKYEG